MRSSLKGTVLTWNGCAITILAAITLPLLVLSALAIWAPSIPFLPEEEGANWIQYRHPVDLSVRDAGQSGETILFERVFQLDNVAPHARLKIKAFRQFRLWINGKMLKRPDSGPNWKEAFTVPIGSVLKKGRNLITLQVSNHRGPPALWATAHHLPVELGTDHRWTASLQGQPPVAAVRVGSSYRQPADGYLWPSLRAMKKQWVVLSVYFAAAGALFWFLDAAPHQRRFSTRRVAVPPSVAVMLATLLWVALFIHNHAKFGHLAGFDLIEHLFYVQLLINRPGLPLATDGWSTYHPPLFYLVSAAIEMLHPHHWTVKLKLVPFAAGFFQVVMAYVLSRKLFPGRSAMHWIVVLFAAIIPVNIYTAHFFTNEGLAGALMSAVLVATAAELMKPLPSRRGFLLLGALTGTCLLTKYTGVVLLAVMLIIFLLRTTTPARWRWNDTAVAVSLFIGAVFTVAGWYYIRNWITVGMLFPGNWDSRLGYTWWQDPGAHTAGYFLQFGKVFSNPYFVGLNAFLDSLYATFWGDTMASGTIVLDQGVPWDRNYMAAVIVLAAPATAMLLVGFFSAIYRAIRKNDSVWCLLVIFSAAMFYFICYAALAVPAYSVAKAMFALGAFLPACVFLAIGFAAIDGWLLRHAAWLRVVLYGWLGALTGGIFHCYFI